jgi:hypothetical protein
MQDPDRTASLMTPAKLAEVKPKAAASPAAWLDQMASDVGHVHVRRLAELQEELKAAGPQRDVSALESGLARLSQALPQLDFGLLQKRGLWARVTGQGRDAGAGFVVRFAEIDAAIQALAVQVQALRKRQQERVGTNDRGLLELQVEFADIDKIIDQGARWLQDMRGQLKARQASVTDDAGREQLAHDAARCEKLLVRLKLLRAVSSAAQRTYQQAQGTAARREAFSQMLQQALTADAQDWRTRMAAVAAAAADGSSPSLNLEVPMESHRDLQLCIKQAIADCAQLQEQEAALGEHLAILAAELRAASERA